jgi:hypothetical protein
MIHPNGKTERAKSAAISVATTKFGAVICTITAASNARIHPDNRARFAAAFSGLE